MVTLTLVGLKASLYTASSCRTDGYLGRTTPEFENELEEVVMQQIKIAVQKFIRDEDGLTTVEYAIAGGLVGAGVIAAFSTLGNEVNRVISAIGTALTGITIQTS